MGYWEQRRLSTGGTESIHYESDGSPSGLREYSNPNNNRGDGGIYDGINNGTECVRCTHGQCRRCDGKQMSANRYETRQGGGLFRRKGVVTNSVKCDCCGRVDHV